MRVRQMGISLVAIFALALTALAGSARAQDATPAMTGGPFDQLGLPRIDVTLTDEGLQGVPAETQEGWHLVSFTNSITGTGDPFEDSWSVEFVMLPDGMTIDDVAALFAEAPEGEEGAEGATPAVMEEATPEVAMGAEEASPVAGEDPFAFLYETYLAGGPGALRGETGQAVIYLEDGNYAALVFGFSEPVALTVTDAGESVAATPVSEAVTADVTITETGTSGTFDFSVELGTYAGGPGVIEIFNDADQPHFIFAAHSSAPITEDEVMTLLMTEEGATPAAGGPDLSQISPAFLTGTQSNGVTQYISVDLEPGYLILLCFVGDPNEEGLPHAFQGMIEVVQIGA